jgi:DNA polymerase III gamma/tau subunit
MEVSPEQLTRMLDALREGESLVRLGLSEKANFEVTIFRAIEACRTRSIDQVIRKISQVLPADIKKKSVAKVKSPSTRSDQQKDLKGSPDLAVIEAPLEKEIIQPGPEICETNLVTPIHNQKKEVLPSTEGLKEELSNRDTIHPSPLDNSSIHSKDKNDLRIVDPEKIKERVDELPEEIREIVEKKFKAEYVALEKIDPQILI